jgi:hypothetical protein
MMKIKCLIHDLQKAEATYGNIDVQHWSDEEGNMESGITLLPLTNGTQVYAIVFIPSDRRD